MLIIQATRDHADDIWSIIGPTIRAAETYTIDPGIAKEAAIDHWLGADRQTFVAIEGGETLGTYYIRPNQAGGGDHVANCGYMTHSAAAGRGIARRMCEHSMDHARARGFRAMQFNFVISTNAPAVHLWQSLGFDIVGRLPGAFRHPSLGYVDALVMYRTL